MKIREETLAEIVQRKEAGKIFCFGAGNYGRRFLTDPIFKELHEDVRAFVDNSIEKAGQMLQAAGREYPVIGVDELLAIVKPRDIIIVTCKEYLSVLKQLNEISALAQISCYVYIMLCDYLYDKKVSEVFVPDQLRLTDGPQIPRVIHYCWFGKSKLPQSSRLWIESWKKYCPDYEIIEWNESNYDVTKNGYMRQAYENGKWAFVSDYARVDIVYRYGGIYLDTDVELVRNMDELLYQRGFCGFQNGVEINFGLGFGSVKQNEIIRLILDEYKNMEFCDKDGNLNLVLCPEIQGKVLHGKGIILNGSYQAIPDMTVFPERVLSGKSQKTRRLNITDKTYSVHHFDASWMEKEEYQSRRERDRSIREYMQMLNGDRERRAGGHA